MEVVKDQSC